MFPFQETKDSSSTYRNSEELINCCFLHIQIFNINTKEKSLKMPWKKSFNAAEIN